MKRGFFITGTDTNVGKTVVSAWLMLALRKQSRVRYWKPIQTGIEVDDDTQTVRELAQCSDREIFDAGYRLEKPLSPHLSARLAGVTIEVQHIKQLLATQGDDAFWIVEGAGGVFVPLNDNELMIDLIRALKLPVLIVARSGLGTINHTLLTLEALRQKDVQIHGVVMNGEPNPENRLAIEKYGCARVIGELPPMKFVTPESLNAQVNQPRSNFTANT